MTEDKIDVDENGDTISRDEENENEEVDENEEHVDVEEDGDTISKDSENKDE
jgi:hypothetical protein